MANIAIEFIFLNWLQSMRTPIGDFLMPLISSLGNGGAVWIILTLLLLLIPKTRHSGIILALALCADVVLCNGILKNLFARVRPYDINTSIQLLIPRPHDFSFPSGHTAASFAVVTALYLGKERRLLLPSFILALLISFSRMYLYVHFPTDIAGGIIVGAIAGWIGFYMADKGRRYVS